MENQENNQIIIYQSDDGETRIDVKFTDETLWLSQQQMAELYQTSRSNVVEHIKHIYEDGELDDISTCRKFRQVQTEGTRQVSREIPFYNLDMIISLGYRIRSVIATHFRRWATERLKDIVFVV
ncbi:MAG: virulence RhuM family protein [Duncaniella sp.]|nr:virulence RhuM family protein [Duncaniella sp.]